MRYRPRVNINPSSHERFDRLDALRGIAIVWMAVYHFFFDLNHFRIIQQNFYTDPFWTTQRSFIVAIFLFCAGFGQAVALHRGQGWPRFWRRWLQVAGSRCWSASGRGSCFRAVSSASAFCMRSQ